MKKKANELKTIKVLEKLMKRCESILFFLICENDCH